MATLKVNKAKTTMANFYQIQETPCHIFQAFATVAGECVTLLKN